MSGASAALTMQSVKDVTTWIGKAARWAGGAILFGSLYAMFFLLVLVIVIDMAAGVCYMHDRIHPCHRPTVSPKQPDAPAPTPVAPPHGCAAGCHCGLDGCDCAKRVKLVIGDCPDVQ